MQKLLTEIRKLKKQIKGALIHKGVVEDVDDPEGEDRVRVSCEAIWGADLSPWCVHIARVGGDDKGTSDTPSVGDEVCIQLLAGNPDTPLWFGGFRSPRSQVPEELADKQKRGIKSESGVYVVRDDEDKSYKIHVPSDAEVYLDGDGIVHLTGVEIITHGKTRLNEGTIKIALGGPTVVCPVTNKPIPSSALCFVSGE